MAEHKSLEQLLAQINEFGNLRSQDFQAYALGLVEEMVYQHNLNRILKINTSRKVKFNGQTLVFTGKSESPEHWTKPLFRKQNALTPIEVSEEFKEVIDADGFSDSYQNLSILKEFNTEIKKPVYFSEYRCWEEVCDHFDPVTDIFSVGMVLASLAFGLDFNKADELENFASFRNQLYFLNRHLHPALIQVIQEMTELYREDRIQDANEVLVRIRNYREVNPENHVDLTQTEGFKNQDISSRGNWILSRLKNRLHDMSKRNNLLYYKEKDKFINLTVSSIPHILDHKNIKEEDILLWNERFSKKIKDEKSLKLNSYLQFRTNKYLAPRINKVRLEARKSNNEFGFSPLRTVVAFIHWYNFKENPEEKITSPFLLIKTDLVKKKGLKDSFQLEFEDLVAEVNPVIVQYFKDAFGIILPDYLDLETSSVSDLIQTLKKQVESGDSGVRISWKRVPQIKLLHSIAKRKLNTLRRKTSKRGSKLNIRSIDYSYNVNDFIPLGLELFKLKVRAKNQHLEYIINENISPSSHYVIDEKEASFYQVDTDSKTDPYHWEVDTTNMTLGNFNFRKMSLVKDYNDIIEAEIKDDVFEQLFSDLPVRQEEQNYERNLASDFPIVPLDPTQNFAINQARTGKSYVIQGPPGTGKSQTITNLIADFLAAGKKVLFVCEKRAALDVVYHRLKNRGLDVLSSLVHDSRSDKKEFILDLKRTYEKLLREKNDLNKKQEKRNSIIGRIQKNVHALEDFHSGMSKGETPVHHLIETVIQHNNDFDALANQAHNILPSFKEWSDNRQWVRKLIEILKEKGISKTISDCHLLHVQPKLFESSNGKQDLEQGLKNLELKLDDLIEEADLESDIDISSLTLLELSDRRELALILKPLLEKQALSVLDLNSELASDFNTEVSKMEAIQIKLSVQKEKNTNWSKELKLDDCHRLVNSWNEKNSGIFKFLKPSYYALKKQIKSLYDFNNHQIKPTENDVIQELEKELKIHELLENKHQELKVKFGLSDLTNQIEWIKLNQKSKTKLLSSWLNNESPNSIDFFSSTAALIKELSQNVSEVFVTERNQSLTQLSADLNAVKDKLQFFSLLKPHAELIGNSSKKFKSMLLENNWHFNEMEFHCSYNEMLNFFESNPSLKHTDSVTLQNNASSIQLLLNDYYRSNVEVIQGEVTKQFLNQIRITESPAAQLTEEEKIQKKTLKTGRKILENEFGKSMRYKSVRELFNNEAKSIMTTIKPVWLMSPLSLSDIMPIDTETFDVVIFDEASQITLEEGVPALFRTKQIIVVGDEMQMPPTNFFGSNTNSEEDLEQEESVLGFSLDADSILNQSCRKLSSVMLGWHYRSRRESLISFSNAAFYNRGLLTIPDASYKLDDRSTESSGSVTEIDAQDIKTHLQKSISYHYLEHGVYEKRKNSEEARYIAQLVRSILKSDENKSIGIVAFSMDQQNEIETALEMLGSEDPEFETALEEEYQRIEEDQFCGLFVKNLENVQGDERDIIILSICYAQNSTGRMYMNFGPINRRGGEKRLNVIFSRSKQNMMVVSSILPHEITNDYNEGANYFKKFLSYAKHTSDGKLSEANSVLESLHKSDETIIKNSIHRLQEELETALSQRGYQVQSSVGQSNFKCDVVISKPEEGDKSLAILIDHKQHYLNTDVLEQYVLKPEILRNFGWKSCRVYSKDWLLDKDQVLKDIDIAFIQDPQPQILDDINQSEESIPQPELEKHIKDEEPVTIEKPEQIEKEETQASTAEAADWHRLEFSEGNSNKFWQVRTHQADLIVEYGRIGNKPQQRIKSFDSDERAKREMASLIIKKEQKGYNRV